MSHFETLQYWEVRLEQAIEYLETCGYEFMGIADNNGNTYTNHFRHNGIDLYYSNMDVIGFQDDGTLPDYEADLLDHYGY